MNSTIKNTRRWTLYSILPFIVVLLAGTVAFGQPNVYETQTSFPITIIFGSYGGGVFKNVTNNFSGKINLYYGNGIQGQGGELIPNADGCYVSFSGDDGTTICITSINSVSADTNRPRGSDPTLLVGTGTIETSFGGSIQQGFVYIDVKGTWKRDPSKETLLFNGKIGGGGQDLRGPDFILTGSFKSTFAFSND